jgi:uncharacterized protein (TIGR02118 family)
MAGAKLMVMYPPPKDLEAFERAYRDEHIPMAAAIFQRAGATKAVLSKTTGSPTGAPAFHRIAEIHFPSWAALEACASSRDGQDALAHAQKISNGGPPVVMVAEEETVSL